MESGAGEGLANTHKELSSPGGTTGTQFGKSSGAPAPRRPGKKKKN